MPVDAKSDDLELQWCFDSEVRFGGQELHEHVVAQTSFEDHEKERANNCFELLNVSHHLLNTCKLSFCTTRSQTMLHLLTV
jgi:hypothetical protein